MALTASIDNARLMEYFHTEESYIYQYRPIFSVQLIMGKGPQLNDWVNLLVFEDKALSIFPDDQSNQIRTLEDTVQV